MVFEEKEVVLKNGQRVIFKTPEVEDAECMLKYIIQACGESEFLGKYPEEWEKTTAERERKWIENLRKSQNTFMIACYFDGKIIGNCEINTLQGMKHGHRSSVAIAILKDYWGLGIGSAMFCELIKEAERRKTEIIELDYIEGNDRGVALYEKFGFKTVAEKPRAVKTKDGRYLSLFYMQKSLL